MITLRKDKTQTNELIKMKDSFDVLKKKTTNMALLLRECEPILKQIQTLYGYEPVYPVGTLGHSWGTKSKELLTEIEKLKENEN